MKYLSDYTQEEQTKLFEEFGVFFAYNREQFEEGKKKYGHLKPEGTKFADLGMGMFAPSVNVGAIEAGLKNIHKRGIERDLKENGREGVLERELGNYEIGYSWEGMYDRNFRDGIKGYGFTEKEIEVAYNKHIQEHEY